VIIPHRQGIYFMADSYEHFLKVRREEREGGRRVVDAERVSVCLWQL
jgi:hypothetical protein